MEIDVKKRIFDVITSKLMLISQILFMPFPKNYKICFNPFYEHSYVCRNGTYVYLDGHKNFKMYAANHSEYPRVKCVVF